MPPAPATRPRAEAAGRTRAALIEAAIGRFAADGPGVSFDVIAAEVGVTKGALYHHFGSKEGLVEEVYKEAVRRHADRVVAASTTGDGRSRLLALIDTSADLYGSRTPFYRLLTRLHVEAGTSRPHLAPIARRVQERQRAFMIDLVSAGQKDGSISPALDPEAVGLTVNAALEGILVQQLAPLAELRRQTTKFRSLMEEIL